ncbi:CoA ester lyase [Dactylosporangium salmoneum]|uniref:CoA ester lyase n=1 Tax=Dactylosporangium salmoneum TaxID=53361 RepID=A0ABN3FXM3_9ACTN
MSSEQSTALSPSSEPAVPALDFRRVRSVMETPILDERKWSKLPAIPADAFIIDLEDSVVPAAKEAARQRAMRYLADPDFFGDRLVLARPNNLATDWGRDDIIALAEANVRLMLYPKARSADELLEVRELLAAHGAHPLLFPIVETAGAILDLRAVARVPGLGGLFTGIGDLSVDAGVGFRDAGGGISHVLDHAREQVVLAAAAAGVSSTDTVYATDIKDPEAVRVAIADGRGKGFTSLVTFYPPHVPLINELLTPSERELAAARELVGAYEEAQAAGRPALIMPDGRTVLLLDYARAQRLLARAEAGVPTAGDVR